MVAVLTHLQSNIQARYQRWLRRRIPVARSVTFDQRRIFIFPSLAGLLFLVLILIMLLTAINYQNNMAFALAFFLVSLFFVAVYHTYSNLSGLTLQSIEAESGFCGDPIQFTFTLSKTAKRHYHAIDIGWPDKEQISLSLLEHKEQTFHLHYHAEKRGYLIPPRLLVETVYPLGLLRAWSWVAFDTKAIIYPTPVKGVLHNAVGEEGEGDTLSQEIGSDDFYGLREYQLGDSLKHVNWKSYAKGQPLQTKEYASYYEQTHWLDWQCVSGHNEQRLSVLCYWLLKLEREKQEYGLRLPGLTIEAGIGPLHQHKLLTALATFGLREPNE